MWLVQLLIAVMLFVGVTVLLFIYGLIIYFIATLIEEKRESD